MPSLKLLDSVDDDEESSKRKKRKEAHSNEDKCSNDANQTRKAKRTKSSSSTTFGEKKNNTKMDSSKGRNNYTNTKANLDPEAKKSTSTTTISDGKKTKSLKMDEGRPPEYPPGAFVYYQNESRPQFKVNNPILSCSELSQAMHEQFKLLTEEEKKPYYRMRNEALERYNEEMILLRRVVNVFVMGEELQFR